MSTIAIIYSCYSYLLFFWKLTHIFFFFIKAVQKLGKFKLENKVSQFTTHLVAIENSRTINILRGLIRGVWILDYEWVLKSVEANHWLSETDFEMRSFSKAVEV